MGRAGEAWVAAVGHLGGGGGAAADRAADLERRYAEPHRSYHTTTHLEAVLRDSAWLGDQIGLDPDERAIVALAACAHDVVYDAKPGDDERASAQWARHALTTAGLTEDLVQRVEHLVLLTLTHTGDDDAAGAVLLDADLAILAAEPRAYADYVAAVRAEYASVTDEQWRTGRTDVLTNLLKQQPLFHTAPAQQKWEEPARRNLDSELQALRTNPRPSR
ncbi:MAG: hypothetical protein QOF92_2996 [Pseudonocardiales bacterium]|nr:hypothetical protein [Pseudonocardiales bacterium]